VPLYDNIADALALTTDGGTYTIALDNTGATFENNEATEAEPQECVWVKIDLSAYPDGWDVPVPIDLVRTGGGASFAPQFAVFKVIDASFDPSNPDFSKLDWTSPGYYGDGTTDPPADEITLKGGTGSSTGNRSQTGIFYLGFNDYNYAEYGSASIEYSIADSPICFDAVDIINPDSSTATVVSGKVRESSDEYWNNGSAPYITREQTLKFTWGGPTGRYKVYVTGNPSATRNAGVVWAVISVNGRPFLMPKRGQPTGSSTLTWANYNGFDDGTADVYDDADYSEGPWLILASGDTVEVMIVSTLETNLGAFIPFDTERICFEYDGESTNCTGSIAFERDPLGDYWGSPNGWGGQMLVPDQIWVDTGITPYDESNFPWGINISDYDFCVTPDGVVYVFYNESFNVGSGSNGQIDRNYLVVKKYDPDTNTWSQVQTLNVQDPNDQYGLDAVTCEMGPDGFVYAAWWEVDTFTSGSPSSYLWKWHLIKLDPSDDSYVELGTGQNAEGVTLASGQRSNHEMLGQHGTTRAPSIAFSGDDIYVATSEVKNAAFGAFDNYRNRAYVWRWNGATWTNLSLPDPSDVGTSPNLYDVIGENQFWDCLIVMAPANADGPKADGVTVVYCYRRPDSPLERYILATFEYTVGSGWTEVVLTDISTVEGDARTNGTAPSSTPWRRTTLDMDLFWSEKLGKLILTADLGGISDEIWDMFQFGASDWEYLESTAPASAAGPWRQSRNRAALGPDGDIYRAVFSDTLEINFEPHVLKHSPGYEPGYAVATTVPIGKLDSVDAQAETWEGVYVEELATAHYRIRWNGDACYVMGSFSTEPANIVTGSPYGEGVFVLRGNYVPCGAPFRPHFYRRIHG
jgi:hypothetical protein